MTTTTAATTTAATTPRAEAVRRSGPPTTSVTVPGLGEIQLSRPELVYVGGIAALSVLGFLEWPIALVIAGGHLLAADRSSRTVRDLGEAMTDA